MQAQEVDRTRLRTHMYTLGGVLQHLINASGTSSSPSISSTALTAAGPTQAVPPVSFYATAGGVDAAALKHVVLF